MQNKNSGYSILLRSSFPKFRSVYAGKVSYDYDNANDIYDKDANDIYGNVELHRGIVIVEIKMRMLITNGNKNEF